MIFIPYKPFILTRVDVDFTYGFEQDKHLEVLDIFKRIGFSPNLKKFQRRYGATCQKLGAGSYAKTFWTTALPGDAIKIQKKPDPSYQLWMEEFVLTGQHNAFVPKVRGYATNNTSRTLCVMERLYKPKFSAEALNSFEWFRRNTGNTISRDELNAHVKAIFQIETMSQDLMAIIDYIAEASSHGTPHSVDLSRGNIMQRENGEMVITDPLAVFAHTFEAFMAHNQ
ncbi:MAG: hypothetical protein OSB62_02425 [Alphaproteobacteria bacterium]|nr:hypothetical protein [Alphaproteobacteria bacterium]